MTTDAYRFAEARPGLVPLPKAQENCPECGADMRRFRCESTYRHVCERCVRPGSHELTKKQACSICWTELGVPDVSVKAGPFGPVCSPARRLVVGKKPWFWLWWRDVLCTELGTHMHQNCLACGWEGVASAT